MTLTTESFDSELARFHKVVQARTTSTALISLFEKLTVSTMFSMDVKPACFKHLIEVAAQKIQKADLAALIKAIESSPAVRMFRGDFSEDEIEMLFAPLVIKLFDKAGRSIPDRLEIFYLMERLGVSRDSGVTLNIAYLGGMSLDALDALWASVQGKYDPNVVI